MSEEVKLREMLTDFCRAAEYTAGCDSDGVPADGARDEIWSSMGSPMAVAYDKAVAFLATPQPAEARGIVEAALQKALLFADEAAGEGFVLGGIDAVDLHGEIEAALSSISATNLPRYTGIQRAAFEEMLFVLDDICTRGTLVTDGDGESFASDKLALFAKTFGLNVDAFVESYAALSATLSPQAGGGEEVTQADRDFAAQWIVIAPANARRIRSGEWDDHQAVRAALHHRLRATPQPAEARGIVEELREARTTLSIVRTQIMVEIGRCADPSESRWEGVPEKLKERLNAIDAALSATLTPQAGGGGIDSGMSGDAVAQAELLWANLPTGRKWTSLQTHEKALVCNVVRRASPPAPADNAGLVGELEGLVNAASKPNGWDYIFPLAVVPVDGKPTIKANRGGNLFRGYIATWQEADLLVALANNAPRILSALRANGAEREGVS